MTPTFVLLTVCYVACLCFLIHSVCLLVTQLCLTLCHPTDCSPPGFSVHGILQARLLERVAMPSSGDLPDPGIEPASLTSPALAGEFFFFFFLPPEPPGKPGQVRITKAKAGKEQAPQPCGDSLLVQWLGLQDEGVGLIPGQRTKILQATWHRQNKKTKKQLKQKNPKQTWVLNFSAHPGCRITV